MATLSIRGFDGLAPKLSSRLLPDNKAQVAQDALLENGKIVPLQTVSASLKDIPAGTKTLWRFGNTASDTQYWMTFTVDASVMRSPVFDDAHKRLYWTLDDGSSTPRYYPSGSLFSSGLGPTTSLPLGLPAPTAKPVANGASGPKTPVATWQYMVTFTSASGDSDPGPVVEIQAPATRGSAWTTYPVSLSGIPTPENTALYIGKKLWTRKSGSDTWWLVASWTTAGNNLNTKEFTDNLTAASATTYTQPSTKGIARPAAPAPALTAPLSLGDAPVSTQWYYAYCLPQGAYADEWSNRSGPLFGALTPASAAQSVDGSQSVTVSIPVSAYNNRPTNLGSLGLTLPAPMVYAVFRKRSTDAAPVLVGTVDIPGSAVAADFVDSGQAATTTHFMTSYIGGIFLANGNKWGTAQAAPTTPTITTSTQFTAAGKKVYSYCQTFINGTDEGMPSDASEAVTVAETSTARQQGVRIQIEPAPTGLQTRLYRRKDSGTFYLLATLAAGVQAYEDQTLDGLSGTAAPTGTIRPDPPAAAPGATCPAPTSPTLETRGYCYTWVTQYGEESAPSPVSDLVDADPEQNWTVSSLPTSAPSGYTHVTKIRLYRSNAGSAAAAFQFVADITLGSSSYTDTITQAAGLGEVLPSESWDAPPGSLIGLNLGGNGIAAGFTLAEGEGTSRLCFSEPYYPHAWPPEYQKATGTKVVAMVPFAGNAWGVLTTGYPYVAVGTDPASISLEKLGQPQACVSKTSAIATDDGVVYASPDGLCLLTVNNVRVLTEDLLTRAQWQAYDPTTMRSAIHNNRVLVFYTATVDGVSGGVLIFDFTGKSAIMTRSSLRANATFYDALTDQLYLAGGPSGTSLLRWRGGADRTWTWKSKLFSLPQPTTFAWAQVEADSYPVEGRFYVGGTNNAAVPDGTQLAVRSGGAPYTVTFASREPVRLPAWIKYRDLELQLSGSTVVHSVSISHTSKELAQT